MGNPVIGILMLDTAFTRIKGDIGNEDTFSFPVLKKTVPDALPTKIVEEQDPRFLNPFIDSAHALVAEGVKAITTSCGFLAMFQKELAASVKVPVFTSSLLQIPIVYSTLQSEQKVGVLTANSKTLSKKHYLSTDSYEIPKVVMGMENTERFYKVFVKQSDELHIAQIKDEMRQVSLQLMEQHPEVGAIVLECTNMPPFAKVVKETTGLPVYDITTLTNWVADGLMPRSFEV